MHSSSAHQHTAPPRRPPRRWKSTSTAGSCDFSLDDINEDKELRPRAPLRTKSCEELEAELFLEQQAFDDDENAAIPAQIDLSQLAQNLHNIQLQAEADMLWDGELNDDDSDSDLDNDDDMNHDHHRVRRGAGASNLGPTHSFLSVGSSMTAAQQREPGRFVTPASSFYNSRGDAATNAAPMDLTCAGVQPTERVTVDPYQFMSADMSFRLPLVGSLTDSNFVVHKKAKLEDGNSDTDDLEKPCGGRKTIQLDDTNADAMPTISLGMEDEPSSSQPESEEAAAPPPTSKPIMFGKLKRESRRLVRPNLPF